MVKPVDPNAPSSAPAAPGPQPASHPAAPLPPPAKPSAGKLVRQWNAFANADTKPPDAYTYPQGSLHAAVEVDAMPGFIRRAVQPLENLLRERASIIMGALGFWLRYTERNRPGARTYRAKVKPKKDLPPDATPESVPADELLEAAGKAVAAAAGYSIDGCTLTQEKPGPGEKMLDVVRSGPRDVIIK